jgi:hypothetical protein
MAGVGFDPRRVRVAAFLAAIALVFQIGIPFGFMPARTESGLAIVICTGHGPLLAHPDEHGQPGKAPAQSERGMCVFAGHAGVAPPPAPVVLSQSAIVHPAEASSPALDLLPGRGLAAPPPPSRGPPSELI